MDLMDLALQMKDYEWAKELQQEKNTNEIRIDYASLHNQIESESKYSESAIALEDIITSWIIKWNNGVRNLNLMSEVDRIDTEILLAEKDKYNKGEIVKYYIPDFETQCYLKGYLQGTYQQYLNNQNDNTLLHYKSIAESYCEVVKDKADKIDNNDFKPLKKWYQFWK